MSSPAPPNPDAQKLKNILIPAAAVAALIVLAGLIYGLKTAEEPAGPGTPPSDPRDPASIFNAPGGDTSDMSKTLPPLDDPNWKPLVDGIKVWDVKEGSGPEVKPGAHVVCHYSGWLTTGKSFDSSVGKAPLNMALTDLVKGWQLGIPGMKPGGIRRLYIPYPLAYGERGRGGIPPKADLVFEMKMISSR